MPTPNAVAAAMQRALLLAAEAPDPRPNPRVGCVLIDDTGAIIGEGGHAGAGTPHAEILALDDAGQAARGAVAVVTLEPCNHTGRTGPCSHALAEAGVTEVFYGQSDPNPAAMGGAAYLKSVGVRVSEGLMAEAASQLNPYWTFAMHNGRPMVIWKTATTLDGRISAADGSSRWITGEAARAEVQALRGQVDAVLVGTGTMLADDPELTARGSDGSPHQPLRAVMGQRSVPADARMRRAAPMANFTQLPTRDPVFALAQLFRREVHSVLLEGGPTLAGAFLKAGLVDKIRWYTAPALLGAGRNAIADLGIGSMDGIRRFRLGDVARVGDDVRIDLLP